MNLKTKTLLLILFSFLGFLDATYLTIKHFIGGTANCFLGNGCEQVLTSQWSEIGGIPISLIGAGYYLTVFVLSIVFLNNKIGWEIKVITALTSLGLLASLFLVYLQLFVIGQICTYCTASAIITLTLFTIAACTYRSNKKSDNAIASAPIQ